MKEKIVEFVLDSEGVREGDGRGHKREERKHYYTKFYVSLYFTCQIRRQYLCVTLPCSPLPGMKRGMAVGEGLASLYVAS